MTLINALAAIFPSPRLKHKLIELHAYSSDASFYTMVPKAIVFPVNVEEVQQLFIIAKKHKTSLTFRTAGTSLSGQSVTEGILVDLSRHWTKAHVQPGAASVTVQPGITGTAINHLLKKNRKSFHLKILYSLDLIVIIIFIISGYTGIKILQI